MQISKISAQTVVFSKLPTDYLEKQAKFLNSLSAEEKNTLSHRGQALKAMLQWVKVNL